MHLFSNTAKKNNHFALKLMISYSILLLLILLTGLYLYKVSKEKLQNSATFQTKLQLDTSVKTLDNYFTSMQDLAIYFAGNKEISQLSRTEDIFSNEFYRNAYYAQRSSRIYPPFQQLLPIGTYYIHFDNSDFVLSSASFSSMEQYYKYENMLEHHYGQWQDTLKNRDSYMHFLPLSKFKENSPDYLYILPLDTYLFYRIPAKLCFQIDSSKLEQTFASLLAQKGGFLYVMNTSGNAQFTAGSVPGAFDTPSLSVLEYNDDVSKYNAHNETYMVVRQVSSSNGWIYYFVLPEHTINSSLSQFRNMFLLIMAAGLCVGLLFLIFISRFNERPFIQINDQLNDSMNKARELQNSLDYQQPLMQNTFIRNLMLGRISSRDEMEYIKTYLKLTSKDRKYFVLYIVTYPSEQQYDSDMPEYTDEAGEFTFGSSLTYDTYIISCLQKHFGEPLYLFNPKKHNYAILLSQDISCNMKEDGYNIVLGKFGEFHEDLLKQYAIWTIGGIGNTNQHLENTWKSYQQAHEAVSYASASNMIQCYHSLDLSCDAYYYPTQLAQSLTSFITGGNKNQVAEIFKFITKENLEKRSLSYHRIQSLLTEIHSTIARILYAIPEDESNDLISLAERKLKEYPSLTQLEDTAFTLCSFYGQRSSSKQIIEDIKIYIQKNYKDASLCLSRLSDEFQLSESYLSYLFKESTGENFSMYLTKIRMDAALYLVKESALPLSDIYLETGYNNANSFRRVFKKTYGLSAKSIRDEIRNHTAKKEEQL